MEHSVNPLNAVWAPLALGLALGSGISRADIVTPIAPDSTLILGLESTSAHSSTPATITGDGMSNGVGPVNISDVTNNPPSNYGFTSSFSGLKGSAFNGAIQGYTYNFVDSYVIDVPNAQTSAYLFSLNFTSQLGIQNLSARLYDYASGTYRNLTIGGTGPVNGPVAAPWSADQNGTIANTSLSADVSSGEYVLQVVGLQTGTVSGMYSGSLAVTPVPLPAGLPMLMSALGGFGIWVRRRRR